MTEIEVLPLSEFDADPVALVVPRPPRTTEPFPSHVVLCFFHEVLDDLVGSGRGRRIGAFSREVGGHPVYVIDTPGGPVAAFHPGVGAPLAAHHLETAISAGGRVFVACGGAGAVQPGLALGHVVVPTAAVRDEGTSYHYLPAGREVATDPMAVQVLVALLEERGIPHTAAKTWTTDGLFRETREKIERRRLEGCVTVEMEAAAFAAVARFRDVRFGQYLYAGDDVSGPEWDHRRWTRSQVRAVLFELSLVAVVRLDP
ncbi:MAG TPA: nucleoside phosphorylase [Kineosporiaceae bacterium]|nr:nucleoside phosphorylase [Kineosporiaceae bacterium]